MPQMSPMDWLILSMFFLLIYFMSFLLIYFLYHKNLKNFNFKKVKINFYLIW